MDFGLKGKTALVIGGGSGLGAASARALSAEGAHVVLAGRRPDVLAASAAQMANPTTQIVWDVSDPAAAGQRIAEIRAKVGPIDILVRLCSASAPLPTSHA